MRYRKGVAKRIILNCGNGLRELTLKQAAERLRISLAELKDRMDAGEFEAFYRDEHIEIEISTRWAYEKCPLWETAGVCADFEEEG